ncbi:hypothetical protein HK103_001798 [Boothiomyces macroporosus]|uniref:Glycosyl transferase family 25 domain-containing protein n=1 Tax=Boothiomyces macroporosus TaxID=261099 RepID=A0AAD5UAH1_9FUNG|nr:hypothetical protein HK103_001798 [Boothiomyces macroporosus]
MLKRRLVRKILVLIALLTAISLLFKRNTPPIDIPVNITILAPIPEFNQLEVNYPPPNSNIELALNRDYFPSSHIAYTKQNGPEMIQKTLNRQRDYIDIVIDPALKHDFDLLYKDGFCPSNPKCKFSYSSDYKYISSNADTFITNRRSGMLIHDAALHFTKTVLLTSKEQTLVTQNWLRNQSWHGTDTFAYFDQIPAKYKGEQFAKPKFIPVMKTSVSIAQLKQPVNFYEKVPMVTIIVEESYCSAWSNKVHVYQLAKNISSYLPVKIFPSSCRLSFPKSPLDGVCRNNQDCFMKQSTTTFLVDFNYNDNFIVEEFWKSLSYATPVMYLWNQTFNRYMSDPNYVSHKLQGINIGKDEIDFLLTMSDHEGLEFAFRWKQDAESNEFKLFSSALDHSLGNFPCKICEYVKEKKQSVKCMLDQFKNVDRNTVQSVNDFLDKDKQIDGLGVLENTVDAVHIAHYSKSTERRSHMTELLSRMNVEGKFLMGFDKQFIKPEDALCIEKGVLPSEQTSKTRGKLTLGEVSLAVKDFYAIYNILLRNESNTLILEDDVDLNDKADISLVRDIMKYIPSNYAFVQIGQCLDGVLDGFDHGLRRYGAKRIIKANLGDWRHCGSSFITSKTGAILLFKSLPLTYPIDHQIIAQWTDGNEYGSIKNPTHSIYGVWPAIFAPSEDVNRKSSTDIRPGQTFKKSKNSGKKPKDQ